MPTNRNDYMADYMRNYYRKGKKKRRLKGFYHTGLKRWLTKPPHRCPGCEILAPTWCYMCELEGVPQGRSKSLPLTALALH